MNAAHIRNSTRTGRRRACEIAVAVAVAAAAGAAHAGPPVWQVDVYYPLGSIVSYDGRQYSALLSQIDFAGTGWNPTMSNLWQELETRSGERWFNFLGVRLARTDTESQCALAWNADNVYTSGGVASVDGVDYRANWWTQGELPKTHSSTNGAQPWTVLGSCGQRASTADSKEADSKEAMPADIAAPGSQGAVQASAADH